MWGCVYADMRIIVSPSILTLKEKEAEGFPVKRLDRQCQKKFILRRIKKAD